MRKTLLIGLVIFCAVMGIFQPQFTAAQSESTVGVVGVRGDSLIMVTADGETVIDQNSANFYFPLGSNSRGDVLYMYATNNNPFPPGSLYIVDGNQPILITSDFILDYVPYFSDDDHVVYVSNIGDDWVLNDDGLPLYAPVPAYQLNLVNNEIEQIGEARKYAGGGGGGGTSVASDMVYIDNVYSSGFSPFPNFYDAEVYDIAIGDSARIVDTSPDHNQVLLVSNSHLGQFVGTFDLLTGETLQILDHAYASIHWAEDGFIYYSTTEDLAPAYPLLSEDEQAELGDYLGIAWDWSLSHQAQIYRIDPATGTSTLIYQADNVWEISRLNSLNGYLYWDEIPDGTPVIEAFRNGAFDNTYNGDDVFNDYLLPDVYRMPFDGGDAELLAENLARFVPFDKGGAN